MSIRKTSIALAGVLAVALIAGCGTFISPQNVKRTKVQPIVIPNDQFDDAPDFSDHAVEPGNVSVIFRDEFKVRPTPDGKSVTSLDTDEMEAINGILTKYKLVSMRNNGSNDTEEAAEATKKQASNAHGTDIPNRKSEFTFRFLVDANTREIAAQLRQLPSVRTAYRTGRIVPS